MYQCFDAHKSATGESCLQITNNLGTDMFVPPSHLGYSKSLQGYILFSYLLRKGNPPPTPPTPFSCLLGTDFLSLSLPFSYSFCPPPFFTFTQILIEPRYLFMSMSKRPEISLIFRDVF